jgi:TRAP-type C4-dicarboxylate transport system permease large subunit
MVRTGRRWEVNAAGIDLVYFDVLFTIDHAIGLITPPVGVVRNTVMGVGRVKMDEVTRGRLSFMVAAFLVMFLMVFSPQLATVPALWIY